MCEFIFNIHPSSALLFNKSSRLLCLEILIHFTHFCLLDIFENTQQYPDSCKVAYLICLQNGSLNIQTDISENDSYLNTSYVFYIFVTLICKTLLASTLILSVLLSYFFIAVAAFCDWLHLYTLGVCIHLALYYPGAIYTF